MRDDDAVIPIIPIAIIDGALMYGVQMCGAFIHGQDFKSPVQGPGKQNRLLLSARQG